MSTLSLQKKKQRVWHTILGFFFKPQAGEPSSTGSLIFLSSSTIRSKRMPHGLGFGGVPLRFANWVEDSGRGFREAPVSGIRTISINCPNTA